MREVQVVTPWFTTPEQPHAGAFVKAAVDATAARGTVSHVLHLENVAVPGAAGDLRQVVDHTSGDPAVRRIQVPMDPASPRWQVADAHEQALAAAVGRPWGAELVHAHVAMPTGFAVSQVVAPSARLYVSEHASYLGKVLRDREGRAHYGRMAERADLLLFVSNHLRQNAAHAFPEFARKMRLMPNPVDFSGLSLRPEPPTELNRWVYVGGLSAAKGVDRLVRAFVAAEPLRNDLTLTLVGDGALRPEIEALAAERSLTGRIRITGFVPADSVGAILREQDVMLHLSLYETFGVAVLEGIASGLPVVVTRCGGPEETLRGLEHGVVEFVDKAATEDEVVAAWRTLARRLGDLDLGGARSTLERRFGVDAVGARLVELYEHGEDRVRPMRVLSVAMFAGRQSSVVRDLSYVAEHEGQGTLLTVRSSAWEALDPRVQVLELESLEDQLLPMRLQRFVLQGLPDAPLRALGVLARQAGARGLIPAAKARQVRDRLDRSRRSVERAGGSMHRRLLRLPPYKFARPYVLGRLVSRRLLPSLALEEFDQVVIAEPGAWATGYRLRSLRPEVALRDNLDRDAVDRWVTSEPSDR